MSEESDGIRSRLSVSGKAGENVSGVGGFPCHVSACGLVCGLGSCPGVSRPGPFRILRASRRMLCRRCSCEDMKGAELRSPVQRVMSTQSRDSLRCVRSLVSCGRRRGVSGERLRWIGWWVRRRRWSDCVVMYR